MTVRTARKPTGVSVSETVLEFSGFWMDSSPDLYVAWRGPRSPHELVIVNSVERHTIFGVKPTDGMVYFEGEWWFNYDVAR